MKKIKKLKTLILLIIIFIIGVFFLSNIIISSEKFSNIKSLFNSEQKQIIKKYFFPYKYISELEKEKSNLVLNPNFKKEYSTNLSILEIIYNKEGQDIEIKKEDDLKLSNNQILKKYKLLDGFYSGINNINPGSGYIDIAYEKLFVLSARGVIAYSDKNKLSDGAFFYQIKNNINDFIGINEFSKNKWFSIKDLLISDDRVFVSFTEEIEENCWNTSVIFAKFDYEFLDFKKLFSSKDCVHSINNIDKEFNAYQSGGKIIKFDDQNVILSIGDYRSRHLAQNKKSINGKLIKINFNNFDYKIISMGHRNPQGLFLDRENNFIIETEHGPAGGDEINLIEIDKINYETILNYGWAISSAGEHYGGKIIENEKKYQKYPLYKSHNEYGFIEPIKSFVPSIAISEIIKINSNNYVVGSLKSKSIYFFELDNNRKINNLNKVEVFERVRDLAFDNSKLYLFLEDSASIAVIELN